MSYHPLGGGAIGIDLGSATRTCVCIYNPPSKHNSTLICLTASLLRGVAQVLLQHLTLSLFLCTFVTVVTETPPLLSCGGGNRVRYYYLSVLRILVSCKLRQCYVPLGYDNATYFRVRTRLNGHKRMNRMTEEDEVGFLNPDRLKETAKKQESGELTCNIDDPEDCESCSG